MLSRIWSETQSLDPTGADVIEELRKCAQAEPAGDGFDLTYELSGNPAGPRSGNRCHRIRRPRGDRLVVWRKTG